MNVLILPLKLIPVVLVALLGACGKPESPALAAAPTLLVAAQDLITVQQGALSQGPTITGTLQPKRRADLRAEVSSTVLQVIRDNGDKVRRGDALVRLDDAAIRDSLNSAEDAVRSSSQTLGQLERQYQRLRTLRESGMVSAQQLEEVEGRRNTAHSDLSAARTRAVQARQQLERTMARAPFDGVVSERKVSAGDTVQVGKELLKVIDPASMRFEGLVAADALAQIRVGQSVSFRVNGYGAQEWSGTIGRINPLASVSTRQVEVVVEIAGGKPLPLAGLYAEGVIEVARNATLMVPAGALVREADKAFGWLVKDATLRKVSLELGAKDPRSGDFEVRRGLQPGDQVIRNPTPALKEGQKVQTGERGTMPAGVASAVAR